MQRYDYHLLVKLISLFFFPFAFFPLFLFTFRENAQVTREHWPIKVVSLSCLLRSPNISHPTGIPLPKVDVCKPCEMQIWKEVVFFQSIQRKLFPLGMTFFLSSSKKYHIILLPSWWNRTIAVYWMSNEEQGKIVKVLLFLRLQQRLESRFQLHSLIPKNKWTNFNPAIVFIFLDLVPCYD